MHELEGLDVREIGVLLGISAVTVRWHLSKARRELARILKPQMGKNNDKS
jgi:DNA-directed RNA polymerase specialized sigma24 family protein